MPRRRMDARAIREILRLRSLNLSIRQISRSVNKARSSVNDIVRKAEEAGLKWPLCEDVDDRRLEEILYSKSGAVCEGKVVPEWL